MTLAQKSPTLSLSRASTRLTPFPTHSASKNLAPKTIAGAPMTPRAVTAVRWRLFQG